MILAFGAESREVYINQSGHLQVILFSPQGREIIVRDLHDGDIFGELAAIDGVPRNATIVAVQDSSLLVVPADVFRAAALDSRENSTWFAALLVRQIRTLTQRIFELSALNVRSRLHCELLRMSVSAGIIENRATIDGMPTHDVIAARIGTHREAVTRELSYLTSRGLIKRGKGMLTVHDIAKLASLVIEESGGLDRTIADAIKNSRASVQASD